MIAGARERAVHPFRASSTRRVPNLTGCYTFATNTMDGT